MHSNTVSFKNRPGNHLPTASPGVQGLRISGRQLKSCGPSKKPLQLSGKKIKQLPIKQPKTTPCASFSQGKWLLLFYPPHHHQHHSLTAAAKCFEVPRLLVCNPWTTPREQVQFWAPGSRNGQWSLRELHNFQSRIMQRLLKKNFIALQNFYKHTGFVLREHFFICLYMHKIYLKGYSWARKQHWLPIGKKLYGEGQE